MYKCKSVPTFHIKRNTPMPEDAFDRKRNIAVLGMLSVRSNKYNTSNRLAIQMHHKYPEP